MADALEVAQAHQKILEIDEKISRIKEIIEVAPKQIEKAFAIRRKENEIWDEYLKPGIDSGGYEVYMAHNRRYHKKIAELRSTHGDSLDLMQRYDMQNLYVQNGQAAHDLSQLESERARYEAVISSFYNALERYEDTENEKVRELADEIETLMDQIKGLARDR